MTQLLDSSCGDGALVPARGERPGHKTAPPHRRAVKSQSGGLRTVAGCFIRGRRGPSRRPAVPAGPSVALERNALQDGPTSRSAGGQ
jgi:hypothetical protein